MHVNRNTRRMNVGVFGCLGSNWLSARMK